jgi:hypothetical protein
MFISMAVVAAGLSVPAASGEDPPTLRTLLDSCNRAEGVSGAVTDRQGVPVSDAPVMVHAHVDTTQQRVELPLLGTTRTDGRGCYHVPLRATRQLALAADPYGVVNLEITLQRPDGLEFVNLPRRLVVRDGSVVLQGVDTARPSLRMPTAGRGWGEGVAGALHQSFGEQADRDRSTHGVGVAPDRGPLPLQTDASLRYMVVKRTKVYDKRPVLVGQWFSTLKGVEQTWTYSQGASSTLGSALKVIGPGSGYEKGQTYAKSTSATVTFPPAHGRVSKYYRTYFRYALYSHYYCDGVACGLVAQEIRPYKWERGTEVISHVPQFKVKGKYCTKYEAHSRDESKGSVAITWSDGVKVGGELAEELGLELSLSARTGFTNEAQNEIEFGRHGRLCGKYGPLSGSPRILTARPWPR